MTLLAASSTGSSRRCTSSTPFSTLSRSVLWRRSTGRAAGAAGGASCRREQEGRRQGCRDLESSHPSPQAGQRRLVTCCGGRRTALERNYHCQGLQQLTTDSSDMTPAAHSTTRWYASARSARCCKYLRRVEPSMSAQHAIPSAFSRSAYQTAFRPRTCDREQWHPLLQVKLAAWSANTPPKGGAGIVAATRAQPPMPAAVLQTALQAAPSGRQQVLVTARRSVGRQSAKRIALKCCAAPEAEQQVQQAASVPSAAATAASAAASAGQAALTGWVRRKQYDVVALRWESWQLGCVCNGRQLGAASPPADVPLSAV